MVTKIYLVTPVRRVPRLGLFCFGQHFYRRGRYSRIFKAFECVRSDLGVSETPSVVLFSSSLLVNYYKEL